MEFFNKYLFNALKRALSSATPKRRFDIAYYYSRDPRIRTAIDVSPFTDDDRESAEFEIGTTHGSGRASTDSKVRSLIEKQGLVRQSEVIPTNSFSSVRKLNRNSRLLYGIFSSKRNKRFRILKALDKTSMQARELRKTVKVGKSELHYHLALLRSEGLVASRLRTWHITPSGSQLMFILQRLSLGTFAQNAFIPLTLIESLEEEKETFV